MSTNCLSTKLKGQVNNSDLEKIGEIVVTWKPAEAGKSITSINMSASSYFIFKGVTDVELVGNAHFVNANNQNVGKKLTLQPANLVDPVGHPEGVYIYFEDTNEVSLKINPLYGIETVSTNLLHGFPGIPNCIAIKGLSHLKYADYLNSIVVNGSVSADIEELIPVEHLSNVYLRGLTITGNISVLGKINQIAAIDINNTSCYGSVESVVENLGNIPDTTSAKIWKIFSNNITLKGVQNVTTLAVSKSGNIITLYDNYNQLTVATYDQSTGSWS